MKGIVIKMKRILLLLLVLLTLCFTTSCNKNDVSGKLQMSGSFYDNLADFKYAEENDDMLEDVEHISLITKSYLENVTYEIVEIDKENGIATLEVSVPNFEYLLPSLTSDVLEENKDASYEYLLQIVRSELEKGLSNEGIEKTSTIVDLPIEKIDDKYKLVSNEQWEQIVFGNLENMYIEYYRTMIGGMTYENPN